VVVDGDGDFPEFLVGRWKSDNGNWEFVFEEDGTISSAVVYWGGTTVKPGGVTKYRTRGGGKAVWKSDTWKIQYTDATRELIVIAKMRDVSIQMGPNTLTGSTEDYFVGTISEDHKVWTCDWYNYPKWDKLPVDPNEVAPEKLVFAKLGSDN
jgi:hypothetical protein